MMEIEFQKITATRDPVRVELEYIGEGLYGDYDPEDPEDKPLIRVNVERFYRKGEKVEKIAAEFDEIADKDEWRYCIDSSCCTQLPVTLPREQLQLAAEVMLDRVFVPVRDLQHCKRLFEGLSWFGPDDIKVRPQAGRPKARRE